MLAQPALLAIAAGLLAGAAADRDAASTDHPAGPTPVPTPVPDLTGPTISNFAVAGTRDAGTGWTSTITHQAGWTFGEILWSITAKDNKGNVTTTASPPKGERSGLRVRMHRVARIRAAPGDLVTA